VFVDVLLDRPLPAPLVYRLDESNAGKDIIGSCVVVPLGREETVGIVIGFNAAPSIDAGRVRSVRRVVASVAPLSQHWLALTRFAADYYQYGWGEVAVPALPPLLRKVPGARFEGSLARARAKSDSQDLPPPAAAVQLTTEQREAVAALRSTHGFAAFLLYGVTGSGKTEVYLEAIAERLVESESAQALVLVPEINLSPALVRAVAMRFPHARIAEMHSGTVGSSGSDERNRAHHPRRRCKDR